MDKTTHTPGPWELDVYPDVSEGFRIRMGSTVPYTGVYRSEHIIEWDPGVYPVEEGDEPDAEHRQYLEAEANARRIVAAVNAVEGIPTEALEGGIHGNAIQQARSALRAAKDTLEGLIVDELTEDQESSVTVALESYIKPALRGLEVRSSA